MASNIPNVSIENARIMFRNFSGKENKFNREGKRNFCVVIDNLDYAKDLEEEGWNIRYLQARDDDASPTAYMQVSCNFDNYPPRVYMMKGDGTKTQLDEESIGILDWAEIENVDLIIRPYPWDVNGKHGIKGYLKSMWITIYQDEFEQKYASMRDGE